MAAWQDRDSRAGFEGVLLDGVDDVLEEDLGGQRVSVVDDRLVVRPVPTVHCKHTLTLHYITLHYITLHYITYKFLVSMQCTGNSGCFFPRESEQP